MTEEEVRATARDTFGARDDEMTVVADAADGTTLLIVHVPQLDATSARGGSATSSAIHRTGSSRST